MLSEIFVLIKCIKVLVFGVLEVSPEIQESLFPEIFPETYMKNFPLEIVRNFLGFSFFEIQEIL